MPILLMRLTAGSDISFSDDINAAADSVITDEESSGNSDSLLSMGNSQRVQKALKKMATGEKVNIVFLLADQLHMAIL